MRHDATMRRLIPKTALWHFYTLLRRFGSTAFHLQAAKECLRRPDQLEEMIEFSLEHASLYDNTEEGFHERSEQGTLSAARSGNSDAANRLLRRVVAGEYELPDN